MSISNRKNLVEALELFQKVAVASTGISHEAKTGENSPLKNYKSTAKSTPHIFSNDSHMKEQLDIFSEIPHSLVTDDKPAVAVVIGEGYFLDSAFLYQEHANVILFIDADPRVLEHNRFLVEEIRQANNREEFLENCTSNKNPVLRGDYTSYLYASTPITGNENKVDVKIDAKVFKSMILQRQNVDFLGEYAILSSEAQFLKSKEAISKLSFVYLQCNFVDFNIACSLDDIFRKHNATVSIIQLTNLFDYAANYPVRYANNHDKKNEPWVSSGELYEALTVLLNPDQPVHIFFSQLSKRHRYSLLECSHACSVKEYIQKTQQYAEEINMVTGKKSLQPLSIVSSVWSLRTTRRLTFTGLFAHEYKKDELTPSIQKQIAELLNYYCKQFVLDHEPMLTFYFRNKDHIVDAFIDISKKSDNYDLLSSYLAFMKVNHHHYRDKDTGKEYLILESINSAPQKLSQSLTKIREGIEKVTSNSLRAISLSL